MHIASSEDHRNSLPATQPAMLLTSALSRQPVPSPPMTSSAQRRNSVRHRIALF
jgi:hypothetical protein